MDLQVQKSQGTKYTVEVSGPVHVFSPPSTWTPWDALNSSYWHSALLALYKLTSTEWQRYMQYLWSTYWSPTLHIKKRNKKLYLQKHNYSELYLHMFIWLWSLTSISDSLTAKTIITIKILFSDIISALTPSWNWLEKWNLSIQFVTSIVMLPSGHAVWKRKLFTTIWN